MKQRIQEMWSEVSKVLNKIPSITHVGNPVLRTTCSPVDLIEGKRIAQLLIETLDTYRKLTHIGAGLAAPQIGISAMVFVTATPDGFETYINPELTSSSQKTNLYRESCLSSRMFWGDVERPETIEMSWTDIQGAKHTETFSDFKARLLQHEYDHLLGICCIDKAVPGTLEYCGDVKKEKLR